MVDGVLPQIVRSWTFCVFESAMVLIIIITVLPIITLLMVPLAGLYVVVLVCHFVAFTFILQNIYTRCGTCYWNGDISLYSRLLSLGCYYIIHIYMLQCACCFAVLSAPLICSIYRCCRTRWLKRIRHL